jgi:transcriptional regulator with XRE-family HTH domain
VNVCQQFLSFLLIYFHICVIFTLSEGGEEKMLQLYKNIKMLREEKGLSQDELAKLCGYTSRSSIAKIEKGEVDLQNSKILLFANALGTTPGKLMGLTDFDSKEPTTIAAHFDGDDFTEDELEDIRAYADFVKNRRNKK